VLLGEELPRVRRDDQILLRIVRNAHGKDGGIGHAGFFGLGPIEPDPREAFRLSLVHHEEGEAILSFLRTGKGQRDSSDVGLRRHS